MKFRMQIDFDFQENQEINVKIKDLSNNLEENKDLLDNKEYIGISNKIMFILSSFLKKEIKE